MIIEKSNFKQLSLTGHNDAYVDIESIYKHNNIRGNRLDGKKELFEYAKTHKYYKIYLTNQEIDNGFTIHDNDVLVNIKAFQEFYKKTKASGDIANAFFCQDHEITQQQKDEVIQNISDDDLTVAVNNASTETKQKLALLLKNFALKTKDYNASHTSVEDANKVLIDAIKNTEKIHAVSNAICQSQIEILKKYKEFLTNNLDKEETFITDWLDGKIDFKGQITTENTELRKSRCLIFGLEYANHKREGQDSAGKRFDLLMSPSDTNEYILFELKSPNVELFIDKQYTTKNDTTTHSIIINDDLARAIPQILGYKSKLEKLTDEDSQEKITNTRKKINIKKCIIVIGKSDEDLTTTKMQNLYNLRQTLNSNLEIWTYTDLIDKMNNTIENLTNNLTQ